MAQRVEFPRRSLVELSAGDRPAARTRREMGPVVPIGRRFRGPLCDELPAALLDPTCLQRGTSRKPEVARLLDQHVAMRADQAPQLWALLWPEVGLRNQFKPPASVR